MNTQGKVLVTGANGFVGSAVAHKLVEAGFSVRALVREKGPYSNLADLDIEFIEGDLRDRASIDRAVAGVRYVFHVAADYRLWAPDPGEIYATNLEGTRNVMQAALRAGVERIVHTSSVATIGIRCAVRGASFHWGLSSVGRIQAKFMPPTSRAPATSCRRRCARASSGSFIPAAWRPCLAVR